MIPDWSSLWKREPGLRPDDLSGAHDSWNLGFPTAELTNEAAAALCRDAAVRWLGTRSAVHINGHGGAWRVFVQIAGPADAPVDSDITIDGIRYERFGGVTLDAALFDACAAKLARSS